MIPREIYASTASRRDRRWGRRRRREMSVLALRAIGFAAVLTQVLRVVA